ncbi:MAG: hypothetical protein KKC76_17220 [Proteobacteria bacterium]|nr:hypothetical protein [Pseudomonadota bacterium]MBU4295877.1 hypothetical protein [Pseudomonadota bacterium]MCG2748398.1 hypothetical protein [Desulfobulbaceae bacterium]
MKISFRSLCLVLFLLLICQNGIGADYTYPGNKKVLVYSPGYAYWEMDELARYAETYFKPADTKFWDPSLFRCQK